MAVNVNKIESAVPIGPAGTTQQVRNIQVYQIINGVLTPVLMQVVAVADQSGNPVSYDEQTLYPLHLTLLAEIRRELMIQNELVAVLLANTPALAQGVQPAMIVNLDTEYRADPMYDLIKSQTLNA